MTCNQQQVERIWNKPVLFLVCTLICLAVFCAGAVAESGADGRQAWFYGDKYDDHVYDDSLVMSNGNLLLCCTKKESKSTTLAWLICLKPDGSVAWEQFLGEEGTQNVIVRPLELEGGKIALKYHSSKKQKMFYVSTQFFSLDGEPLGEKEEAVDWKMRFPAGNGYLEEDVPNPDEYRYQFITPEGEVLWNLNDVSRVNEVLVTGEGLMLTGSWWEEDHWCSKLTRVSHEGKTLWKCEIPAYPDVTLSATIQTFDGGFLSVGSTQIRASDSAGGWILEEDRTSYLMKWNGQGDLEWVQTYTFAANERGLIGVTETEQGYVASYLSKTDTALSFLLTDLQGKELGRGLHTFSDGGYFSPVQIDFGGEIWIYGAVEGNDGTYDIMVMKVNGDSMFEELKIN